MLDLGLEWRWIEFLGLTMSGIVVLFVLSTSLIHYWRSHSHK